MAGAFVSNLKFLDVEVPEDYSPERARQLLVEASAAADGEEGTRLAAAGDPVPAAETHVVQPHIIAIMNESWADFEEFGNLSLTDRVMEYIPSLDAAKGHAYTSVFGAGTSASEFEFLTGNTMAFLPPGEHSLSAVHSGAVRIHGVCAEGQRIHLSGLSPGREKFLAEKPGLSSAGI